MRKEELLKKKKDIVNHGNWQLRTVLSENDLKMFSINQLEKINQIMNLIDELNFRNESFHSLSVNDVIHVATGKIISIDDNTHEIYECSENEILDSACSQLYKNWKNKKATIM